MTNERAKTIRRIYGILLSLSLVVAGLLTAVIFPMIAGLV